MIRKITSIALLAQFVWLPIVAQPMLTYSAHGMQEGDVVKLVGLKDAQVGSAGANQVWDYSQTAPNGKVNYIDYQLDPERLVAPPATAFACEQADGITVSMSASPTEKLYLGASTPTAIITLSAPIKELAFPFNYGDQINGNFNGIYTNTDDGTTENIAGTYSVVADAWGTLLLPSGVMLKNVLRVKYSKQYTQQHYDALFTVGVTQYLFYADTLRYPVLQIKTTEAACDCGCNNDETIAWVDASVKPLPLPGDHLKPSNKIVPTAAFFYKVYPNPLDAEFRLDYNLPNSTKVVIELFNASGVKLKSFVDATQARGDYSITEDLQTLPAGTYVLQMEADKRIYSEKIIKK